MKAAPKRGHFASLELSTAELRELLGATVSRLETFLDTLPQQPVAHNAGSHRLARELAEPMPEQGSSYRHLLSVLFERVIPVGLNTTSPGYLAYIPGGGLPHAAVADLIADISNRYVGIWLGSPGGVQLEVNVLRWLCTLAGYSSAAGGLFTSGGSMANLGALIAARHHQLGEDFAQGVVYTSAQCHHSVKKAALAAGIRSANIRELPCDANFRLDPRVLAQAIHADRAAALKPFCVVASAGSTAVGAVDPLQALATLCQQEKLWFHVDAAYGGAFLFTERGQVALQGIAAADSITLDPHKGMFLPYGTGCLLVKDRQHLCAANALEAAYLPPSQTDADHWDFADMGPELSRDWRGLRVWLPLKMHGAAAFRAALNEKLDLAQAAAAEIAQLPGIEMVAPPQLSLFAFRHIPAGCTDEALDIHNRRLMSHINQKGRVFLTGVSLQDPLQNRTFFVIRVCVLSFRTHADRMAMLLEDLRAALELSM